MPEILNRKPVGTIRYVNVLTSTVHIYNFCQEVPAVQRRLLLIQSINLHEPDANRLQIMDEHFQGNWPGISRQPQARSQQPPSQVVVTSGSSGPVVQKPGVSQAEFAKKDFYVLVYNQLLERAICGLKAKETNHRILWQQILYFKRLNY